LEPGFLLLSRIRHCAPFVFASVSDTVGAGVVASLKRSGCNMRNPQPPVLPRRLCSCPQFEGG
jgi:hypothetical protein